MSDIENTQKITIAVTVTAPVEKVWECFTLPEQIVHWNFASDEWHSPVAENDLRVGGKFNSRMEAKDGSFGFDFEGTYTSVKVNELIAYTLADTRTVTIAFTKNGDTTEVTETFDPESQNPVEMQQNGWQAILDNFKKYVELA